MRILLTGCAGFIGSHLAERLCRKGHEVVGLDNFDPFYPPELKRENIKPLGEEVRFRLIEGDLREAALLRALFAQHRFEVVVHLAARAGVRPSIEAPLLYEEVNGRGTLMLLEEARKARVPHFVFGSSSSVYGDAPKVPLREDDPDLAPLSPYGATKMAGEHYVATFQRLYGFSAVALRFFTVYGPRQRPDMAIHKFARTILRGEALQVFGKGDTLRDYTYVDDIVSGIEASLQARCGFEVFNLGAGRPVRLIELIELLEETLGRKAKREHVSEQPGDVRATHADIARARERLGYSPEVPIEEGLRKFAEWFLAGGFH